MKVIGICDDEELAARRLERMIREMLGKRPELYGTEWEIRLYFSGEELLEEAGDCTVIFLDVKMPGMDGIETGRRIMIRYPSCKVILATGERDRYKEGYRIHALRFVTKPFEEAEVAEALEAAVDIPLYHQGAGDPLCHRLQRPCEDLHGEEGVPQGRGAGGVRQRAGSQALCPAGPESDRQSDVCGRLLHDRLVYCGGAGLQDFQKEEIGLPAGLCGV